MREFLTGIAIVLIVVLTTILVAPYFVDWNGQRDFLEARLSHALGQKVTIGGSIDLKLLPTPYLVLDQVVVGGDEAPVRVGIHHLDLELSVTPLLHGAFDITEARLEEPTIRMSLEHDRTLPALPAAPAFEADVKFERIQVSDGTLAIADPSSGRTFVLDHLDFDADAASLAGPFKIAGAEGPDGARTKFRLGTTAAENGRSRLHLTIDETPAHAGYDLDGTLDLKNAGTDAIRQSFDGMLAIAGHVATGGDLPTPWKLSGPLKLDPTQAALDGGELRFGSEDAALTLQADASAVFGDHPKIDLNLSAKQLDIDRLAGAPTDDKKPPPPKLPDLATLRRLLASAHPPIETTLDLAVETATYGGETLDAIQAHLGLGGDGQPLKLALDGPGGSHVEADGRLATKDKPAFHGHVDFAADNLPRAVAWLASVAPSMPWSADDVRFKSVKLDGDVTVGADTIRSDKLALTLGRSVLSGKARLDFGDTRTAKIVADLKANPLDLDGLPSLDGLRGSSPFDLDLKLDAKSLNVSQIGDGGLATGHIQLALTKTGRRVALQRLHADDLGGATIDADGSLDPDGAVLALKLDARRLEQTATLLRQLLPSAIGDALVARADALAPANLQIDAKLAPVAGTLTPSTLSITGKLGATRIDANAAPKRDEAGTTTIKGTLDAPDGSTLLSQFGFHTLPVATIGASRVTIAASGKAGEKLDTKIAAAFGGTKLDVAGRFDLLAATAAGSGTARLRGADLTPLLQTLAIAFPDMTGRMPVDLGGGISVGDNGVSIANLKGQIAGTGVGGSLAWTRDPGNKPALGGKLAFDRLSLAGLLGLALGPPHESGEGQVWSKEPFTVGLVDPPRAALALTAKTFDILPGVEATNVNLDLGIAPNLLTLENMKAGLASGQATGALKLRHDGRQATAEGSVALDGVAIDLPALRARLSGHVDLAGSGTSAAALVASLAGSGEATANDLRLPGSDPKALPKIFDDVENDVLSVDEETVVRAFEDDAKAPLEAGTRNFNLSLAAGSLHVAPTDPALPEGAPVVSKIDAALDLATLRLETHVGETLTTLPKNWNGPPPTVVISTEGPLARPARAYDVSGFLNAVAARALARETARVEAYEFDLRERAFFNARLQSERRREQERLKAEDDARKAKIEAARQERLRREAAAKAARDRAEAEKAAREGQPGPDAKPNGAPPGPPPQPPSGRPEPTDPSSLGRY